MKKVINPCGCPITQSNDKIIYENAFVRIEYDDKRLRMMGVIAPLQHKGCLGSVGQCYEDIRKGIPTSNWTYEQLWKLCDAWERWHLNDMRPYCNHMRELGWYEESQELVKIELWTLKAEIVRQRRLSELANLGYTVKSYNDSPVDKELYELREDSDRPHTTYQRRCFISFNDSPFGLLNKPCPVCGYRYGTRWLLEEVPCDVLEWLNGLPDATNAPVWF